MFSMLRARFHREPMPSHSIPDLSGADHALADEQIDPSDIEACIAQIRARRDTPRDPARTNLLLHLGAAEQFASECLHYGDNQSHQTSASHLAMAVESWAGARGRIISDPKIFLAALQTLLEFRGGHTTRRATGGVVFVGCKLNEDTIHMLNRRTRPLDVAPAPRQLGRVLSELFG